MGNGSTAARSCCNVGFLLCIEWLAKAMVCSMKLAQTTTREAVKNVARGMASMGDLGASSEPQVQGGVVEFIDIAM